MEEKKEMIEEKVEETAEENMTMADLSDELEAS